MQPEVSERSREMANDARKDQLRRRIYESELGTKDPSEWVVDVEEAQSDLLKYGEDVPDHVLRTRLWTNVSAEPKYESLVSGICLAQLGALLSRMSVARIWEVGVAIKRLQSQLVPMGALW